MDKEIKLLIQKNVLRDLEIELLDKKLKGMIIPEIVFEIIKELEDKYKK